MTRKETALEALNKKIPKLEEKIASLDRQIAANAGLEGSVIVNNVKEKGANYGYNALTEEYMDMVEGGIVDPAKVTRSALQNATSVASTLLTTESAVAIIKEDNPAPAANPGMGMM